MQPTSTKKKREVGNVGGKWERERGRGKLNLGKRRVVSMCSLCSITCVLQYVLGCKVHLSQRTSLLILFLIPAYFAALSLGVEIRRGTGRRKGGRKRKRERKEKRSNGGR